MTISELNKLKPHGNMWWPFPWQHVAAVEVMNNEWYVGYISERHEEPQDMVVNFMHQSWSHQ